MGFLKKTPQLPMQQPKESKIMELADDEDEVEEYDDNSEEESSVDDEIEEDEETQDEEPKKIVTTPTLPKKEEITEDKLKEYIAWFNERLSFLENRAKTTEAALFRLGNQ